MEENNLADHQLEVQAQVQVQGEELPPSVCKFVQKLWKMVCATDDTIIRWSEDGQSVVVVDPMKLQAWVLPRYFRHGRITSLLRQLTSYSFQRKVDKTNQEYTFKHPHFQKDNIAALVLVTRRPCVDSSAEHNSDMKQRGSKQLPRIIPNSNPPNLFKFKERPRTIADLIAPSLVNGLTADRTRTEQRALVGHPYFAVQPQTVMFAPHFQHFPSSGQTPYACKHPSFGQPATQFPLSALQHPLYPRPLSLVMTMQSRYYPYQIPIDNANSLQDSSVWDSRDTYSDQPAYFPVIASDQRCLYLNPHHEDFRVTPYHTYSDSGMYKRRKINPDGVSYLCHITEELPRSRS